jgi:hypothetical protein
MSTNFAQRDGLELKENREQLGTKIPQGTKRQSDMNTGQQK